MCDKHLGKLGLFSKNAHDLRFIDPHRHAIRHCARCRQALWLPDQASLAHEFVRTQNCDDRFFALLRDDGDFDLALSDVENRVRVIALRKKNFALAMRGYDTAFGSGLKENRRIKPRLSFS